MSKSLKESVKIQVRKTKREKEKRRKEQERLKDSEALRKMENAMMSRLENLLAVDSIRGTGWTWEETQSLKKLGFSYEPIFEESIFSVPSYEGGKYTPAQLLARKYNAELKKARKKRKQEMQPICKELAEKLKSRQFTIESVGLYHNAIAVKVDGNPGKYDYDRTVVSQFLKRRGLRLNRIEEGMIYIEMPD